MRTSFSGEASRAGSDVDVDDEPVEDDAAPSVAIGHWGDGERVMKVLSVAAARLAATNITGHSE